MSRGEQVAGWLPSRAAMRSRLRRPAQVAVAGVALVLAAVGGVPSAAAADGDPLTATATPNSGRSGATVQVVGSGWPKHELVNLATCGGLAIEGSVSCDNHKVVVIGTDDEGNFSTPMRLGKPPRPCPCVIRVTSLGTTRAVDIPVDLSGHPVGPLPAPPPTESMVSVASQRIEDTSSWTALFGAAASGELVLVLHNDSAQPAPVPPLTLSVEPLDGVPSAIAVPALSPVPAGGEQSYRVAFELPAGVGGTYLLRGAVGNGPGFSQQTSHWAWGFFAVDAFLLFLLLMVLLAKAARGREAAHLRGTRHAGGSTATKPRRHARPAVPAPPVIAPAGRHARPASAGPGRHRASKPARARSAVVSLEDLYTAG